MLGAALGKEVKPAELEAELVKLAATEEGRLKAAQIEQDFKLQMERLGLGHIEELERLAAADRDSARKREISVKDRMPMLLGITANIGFFATVGFLLFRTMPVESKDVLLLLLGALTATFKDVYGYYFGSSSGSAKKDDMLANSKDPK